MFSLEIALQIQQTCDKKEKLHLICAFEYVLAVQDSEAIELIYKNLKGDISPFDIKLSREYFVAGKELAGKYLIRK